MAKAFVEIETPENLLHSWFMLVVENVIGKNDKTVEYITQ